MASAAVHHSLAAQGDGPVDGARGRAAATGPRPGPAHRLAAGRITGHRPGRLAGDGTIEQDLDDLAQLSLLGADTVVLDPFNGHPGETHHPEVAWQALATVSAEHATLGITMTTEVTEADLPHLRRCVELATEAVEAGDFPFGSVLVSANGTVLAEDRNREVTAGTRRATRSSHWRGGRRRT